MVLAKSVNNRLSSATGQRQVGFALIIAMVLMAFIILLLTSLAALVSTEIHSSTQIKTAYQARQNALLGMNAALGELQLSLGPDRRISASSDILTPTDGSATAITQTHWTGVWTAEGGRLIWLVSGNEGTTFPEDVSNDAFISVTPDMIVTGLDASGDSIKIDNLSAAILVGSGTVGTLNTADKVVAPLVDAGRGNHYAWWIGDEGTKAKVDLIDPFVASSQSSAPARFLSAQRLHPEMMDGMERFPTDIAELSQMDQVQGLNEIPLAAPNVSAQAVKDNFHAISLYSNGLLTDTRNGGLKQDLNYLFELSDSSFRTEIAHAFDGVTLSQDSFGQLPIAQGEVLLPDWFASAYPDLGQWVTGNGFGVWDAAPPNWTQLRSFYQLKDAVDASGVVARTQTDDRHGLSPILLRARIFTGLSRVPESLSSGGAISSTDPMEIFMHLRVSFVLANPYNTSLKADGYFVSFITNQGHLGYGTETTEKDRFGNWNSLVNALKFRFPSITIPPGEAMIFTLARNEQDASYQENSGYPYVDYAQDGEYLLANDYDELMSIRRPLDNNPSASDYTRSATDNDVLRAAQTSIGFILWNANPSDSATVHQYGQWIEANNGTPYSPALGTAPGDGLPVWGGGMYHILSDLSSYSFTGRGHVYSNYIREINLRSPVRAFESYNTSSSDRLLLSALGVGMASDTDSSGFSYLQELGFDSSGIPTRVPWGMLYRSYDGVEPRYVNILFEVPEMPLNSLGQLQHFNASGFIPGGTANGLDAQFGQNHRSLAKPTGELNSMVFSHDYAIGNSFAPRSMQRQDVYNSQNATYDASWLLNTALWDHFYFSSIPQHGAFDPENDLLVNSRYKPDILSDLSNIEEYRKSATAASTKLKVDGMFNVNSTSVEAWKAFLAGTLGATYQGASDPDLAPYPRTSKQSLLDPSANASYSIANAGDVTDPLSANAGRGYRLLNEDDIADLAKEIVVQVKLRGPFRSLADFVNRMPISKSDDATEPRNNEERDLRIGVRGALQAAIENVNRLRERGEGSTPQWLNPEPNVNSDSKFIQMKESGGWAVSPEHRMQTMYSGGPGNITQGDLLQPLAPYINVRSDTFVIRAYGEYVNEITGDVSKSWCEAVAQRIPDFVDSSDAAPDTEWSQLSDLNRLMGRKFIVTHFRWLSEDEI